MSYTDYQKPPQGQSDVDSHRGSCTEFVERYRRLAEERGAVPGTPAIEPFLERLLRRIADERNLRAACDHLLSDGGDAAGPNGLRLCDLSSLDLWTLVRQLGSDLRNRVYLPGPTRAVRIPKGSGRGFRELHLSNIQDRIVLRGVQQMVQPLVDPSFAANSFGGRPGRSSWQALATASWYVRHRNRSVWLTADLRNAFDSVPQHRLLDVVRSRLPADDFLELIATLIVKDNRRGIDQGSALSPLLLNVYLDHFLDRPWQRQGRPELLRFIDDLLVPHPAGDQSGALASYEALQRLVTSAGMSLKGSKETAIIDLHRPGGAVWLGFQIRLEGRAISYRLAEDEGQEWERNLREQLLLCHNRPSSPQLAQQVVLGIIGQAGPAFPWADQGGFCKRIRSIAAGLAFDELPSNDELRFHWQESYGRWATVRKRTYHELQRRMHPEGGG